LHPRAQAADPPLASRDAGPQQEGSMAVPSPESASAFGASLALPSAPADWPPPLRALWLLEKGDWNRAHELVQHEEDAASAWVHAHIHRIEGDDWNARYWYRRAGRPEGRGDFAAERRQMAAAMLDLTSP
jgi:hypothetical protein